MKVLLFGASLFCLMILLIMDSCSDITGDPCDDTMMKNPDEPTIYLKLHLENQFDSPDATHILSAADKAVYTGTITKYYCGDKKSGSFEFTHTLFLSRDYTPEYLKTGVFLHQPYQFKFENDGDYLMVISKIRLYFKDGKIFECGEGNARYHYEDIFYDVNWFKKFIKIYRIGTGWKEVT